MNEIEAKNCPKCNGKMKVGKLLARYGPIKHYDIVFESAAQKKFLTEKKWLVTYACENCGYTESYIQKNSSQP